MARTIVHEKNFIYTIYAYIHIYIQKMRQYMKNLILGMKFHIKTALVVTGK